MITRPSLLPAAFFLCLALGMEAPAAAFGHGQDAAPPDAGSAGDITPAMRQTIRDRFRKIFMLPDTVLWRYDFTRNYPTGGISVCGRVNYQDSTRRYVGFLKYYARFTDGKIVDTGILPRNANQDPVHANADAYRIACGGP
jgi:hypothetical protein